MKKGCKRKTYAFISLRAFLLKNKVIYLINSRAGEIIAPLTNYMIKYRLSISKAMMNIFGKMELAIHECYWKCLPQHSQESLIFSRSAFNQIFHVYSRVFNVVFSEKNMPMGV
jgi:hypothetical protein